MYVVINHLHLSKPVDELREPVERELKPLMTSLSGFRGFSLVKDAEDRATVLIFWETEADALTGGNAIGPTWFRDNVAPFLASDQQRTLGEVIVQFQG